MARETLKQRTENLNADLSVAAPPEITKAFDRVASAMGAQDFPDTLKIGEQAPSFRLPDAAGRYFALDEALTQHVVALTFYRGSWCPYCNLQLKAYAEIVDELAASGAQLVAVSPMTPENSISFAEVEELPFAVLSDVGGEVAKRYGVLVPFEGEARSTYETAGIDLPKMNGNESWALPAPSVFVIDRDGVVRLAHTNGDWRWRLEPDDLLAAVRRIADPTESAMR